MNEPRRQFDNEPDLNVSERFADDLGNLFAPDRPVPSDIDRAVAEAARRHLARPQRTLWWLKWAVPATAAAAIMLACLWWTYPGATPPVAQGPYLSQVATGTDIDGNGKVDILDAFTLARHIEAKQPMEKMWDFNGDGLIDRRDVDTVALAAVRLNKGV
jgi:hypothetical protein